MGLLSETGEGSAAGGSFVGVGEGDDGVRRGGGDNQPMPNRYNLNNHKE